MTISIIARGMARAQRCGGRERVLAVGAGNVCSMCAPTTNPDPLAEFGRLEVIARQSWIYVRRLLPNRTKPNGLPDHTQIDGCIAASIAEGCE